ncbi:dephospho-CoA kinase [Spiroplasma tabanidicola]|uniref:Dephospho-CoA kinase n=1 Tax=Spiroplasma tabanidicola TaxID=324079 RepID=A0A6I6CIR1_9MOLU|nr:dephospho-CoA kinase [Spiroplasma tabanidicola]QGS51953.1 dephospho-CoA kinase [Spiroplasma tabanidicola]
MKIIGIGGYIGSGKSTLVNYLKDKYNFFVISADLIAKEALKTKVVLNFLIQNIPECVKNNVINTKMLRKIIFNDDQLNDKFVSLVWPVISKKINNILYSTKAINQTYIVEAAVIKGLDINFDLTIFVNKDLQKRIKMVKKRDKANKLEIENISKFQENKAKKLKCDYYIDNNDSLQNLYKRADEIIKNLSTTKD